MLVQLLVNWVCLKNLISFVMKFVIVENIRLQIHLVVPIEAELSMVLEEAHDHFQQVLYGLPYS